MSDFAVGWVCSHAVTSVIYPLKKRISPSVMQKWKFPVTANWQKCKVSLEKGSITSRESNDTTEGLCPPRLIHQICPLDRKREHWHRCFRLAFDFTTGVRGFLPAPLLPDICPDPSPCHWFTYTSFSVCVQSRPSETPLGWVSCVVSRFSISTPPTSPRCWWKDFRGPIHLG